MKLRLCRCSRSYTHFSFCMLCFLDGINKINQGKKLLEPVIKIRKVGDVD